VAPEDKILKLFEKRILAFDIEAARAYGAILKEARRRKLGISRKDAQVAAVAKSYGLTVACLDRSPFLRAGVVCVLPGGC
jgi:predicted nucleic acid-binding protein